MKSDPPADPLHGVTLEQMLSRLAEHLGWEAMGRTVPIRCFTHDPGVASSLKFLRRTPWARARVEALYLRHQPFPPSRADTGADAVIAPGKTR